ncbi:unnamed protein product [Sympodiomycopsis kandeliae]
MALSNQTEGGFGGIYNSSVLPKSLPWNTYNYCNAPRVNAARYTVPEQAKRHGRSRSAELVYVLNIQRHAKRTPDNLVPNGGEAMFNPPSGWDCSEFDIYDYISGGAHVSTFTANPDWNPFNSSIWNGSCDQGQLTPSGFQDAVDHGRDFWSVYGPSGPAAFLSDVNHNTVKFRASPSPRTAQVSSGLLRGMGYPADKPFHVETQSSQIDGIVPSYTCTYADTLRKQIENEDKWADRLKSQSGLFSTVNSVLGTTNASDWNTWIDHAFDFVASRTCHGHPLPRNSQNGESINESTAQKIFAEGDWEYNFIWNDSSQADDYVKYSTAVLVKELALTLQNVLQGKQGREKVQFIVGHDGTIVRLLKTLAQSGVIRWPALGSEVVFEIWKTHSAEKKYYARILSYGETLHSTAKQLTNNDNISAAPVAWTPLSDVVEYLHSRIPSDLVEKCRS